MVAPHRRGTRRSRDAQQLTWLGFEAKGARSKSVGPSLGTALIAHGRAGLMPMRGRWFIAPIVLHAKTMCIDVSRFVPGIGSGRL